MKELNVALRKQERLVLAGVAAQGLPVVQGAQASSPAPNGPDTPEIVHGGSGKAILSKFEVSLGYMRKRIIIKERKTNKQKHKKGPEFPDWKMKPTWFSTRSSAFFSNHCRVSFC